MRKKIRTLCAVMYLVCLSLGIYAAYTDNMPVALFFAITCAGESIAVSIDNWPTMKHKFRGDPQ